MSQEAEGGAGGFRYGGVLLLTLAFALFALTATDGGAVRTIELFVAGATLLVAVLTSLIGAFYYLRVVKLMYFDDPVDTAPIVVRGDAGLALSANAVLLLVLGILPQQLIGLCAIALTQSNFP